MLALEREFKEMAKGGPDIVWSFPEGGVVNGSPTTVAARYDVGP